MSASNDRLAHVDPTEQFAQALRGAGLLLNGTPVMDGQRHRVQVEGDKAGERSGVYIGHLDGWPAGFVQNWRTGLRTNWKAEAEPQGLSPADRARLAAEAAQHRQEREQERERAACKAAAVAAVLWEGAEPVSRHPYLLRKGVAAHGLRVGTPGQAIEVHDKETGELKDRSIAGKLLVPVYDARGRMASLQLLDASGAKMFLPGSRTEGAMMVIGDRRKPGPLLIAEGYATAASVYELTGQPVIVAFNAGNLARVAQQWRDWQPERPIILAGDDDRRREAEGKPNIGREKAEAAAAAIGGAVLLPGFPTGATGKDWNDLSQADRAEARRQLRAGIEAVQAREAARAAPSRFRRRERERGAVMELER